MLALTCIYPLEGLSNSGCPSSKLRPVSQQAAAPDALSGSRPQSAIGSLHRDCTMDILAVHGPPIISRSSAFPTERPRSEQQMQPTALEYLNVYSRPHVHIFHKDLVGTD